MAQPDKKSYSTDRRKHMSVPNFTSKDGNGGMVRCDRRRTPDRRVNSIQVEWAEGIELTPVQIDQ